MCESYGDINYCRYSNENPAVWELYLADNCSENFDASKP